MKIEDCNIYVNDTTVEDRKKMLEVLESYGQPIYRDTDVLKETFPFPSFGFDEDVWAGSGDKANIHLDDFLSEFKPMEKTNRFTTPADIMNALLSGKKLTLSWWTEDKFIELDSAGQIITEMGTKNYTNVFEYNTYEEYIEPPKVFKRYEFCDENSGTKFFVETHDIDQWMTDYDNDYLSFSEVIERKEGKEEC